jgi:hypothetical protein
MRVIRPRKAESIGLIAFRMIRTDSARTPNAAINTSTQPPTANAIFTARLTQSTRAEETARYFTSSSSISKISVAFGPIGPGPLAP